MSRRETLRRMYGVLLRKRQMLARTVAAELDELAEWPLEVGDVVDSALNREHDETSSQLATNASSKLAQIEHALERMRAGRYGICESCGRPISVMRLCAIPQATQCVSCQRNSARPEPEIPTADEYAGRLSDLEFSDGNFQHANV